MNYWKECIEYAFDAAGITATKEQIEQVANDVKGAHEEYGQFSYVPENPLIGELKETKALLQKERNMVFCRNCNATGRVQRYGGTFVSDSDCSVCHGNGKHL